jgi:hypothetical protein
MFAFGGEAGAAILTADSVTDLRALAAASGPGNQVFLVSYVAGTGKGSGMLYWDASATAHDDSCLVFKPQDAGAAGRWRREATLTGGIPDQDCGVLSDGVTDDTAAVQRALGLFTNGRSAIASGTLYHCGNSVISRPLIYGGSPTYNFYYAGCIGQARGLAGAVFTWAGTGYPAMFYFYGANQSHIRNINFDPGPAGRGLVQDIVFTADNAASTTLTGAVTAGADSTVSVKSATNLTIGRFVGVGPGTAGPFEIVQLLGVSGTSISAYFQFDHASGDQVGGSAGSSGSGLEEVAGTAPTEARTTLSNAIKAGSNVMVTPADMTGITVGMPLAVGGVNPSIFTETVFVKSRTGTTFTADFIFDHAAQETIKTATAVVLVGNAEAVGTDQVSETEFTDIGGYCQHDDYAALRFTQAGNVKDHDIFKLNSTGCDYLVAFENSSGVVHIERAQGGSGVADFLLNGTANFVVDSFETEDAAGSRLMLGSVSTNGSVTFNGGQWDGVAPADDEIIRYSGSLSMRGMHLENMRTATSVPRIELIQLFDPVHDRPGSIFSSGNFFQHATNLAPIFYQSGNPIDYNGSLTNAAGIPNLFSFGDYGDSGNLQPVIGQVAAMSAAPAIDGMSGGIVPGRIGQLQRTVSSITIPYTAFRTNATSVDLKALGIPPGMRIVGALANVATAFAGTADPISPTGLFVLRVGTTAGGQELLRDGVVSTAVVLGESDSQLGTCLARATAVQGGCTLHSLAAGQMFVRLTSASGNLSGLRAGSVSLSLILERMF